MSADSTGKVTLGKPVQIGVVVKDIDQAMRMLTELFGIGPWRTTTWPLARPDMQYVFHGKPGHLKMRLAFAPLGPIELELIQPLEGDSDYSRFLERTGGGLHHILFDVPDIEAITAELAKQGVQVLQWGTGLRPGTRWTYLDVEKLVGFRIELRNLVPGSDGVSPVPPTPSTTQTEQSS